VLQLKTSDLKIVDHTSNVNEELQGESPNIEHRTPNSEHQTPQRTANDSAASYSATDSAFAAGLVRLRAIMCVE
jgi:hypothetical protein